MFKKTNLFTILSQFLVIILPFYVILAVFFSTQIGIPKAWFYIKELVIVLLWITLIYEFIKNKILPKLDIIDYLIFWYFIYGIAITFINGLWINSIIYGWRYDFIFLVVLLIFKHWKQFLKIKVKDLMKIFLISGGISLFFSILIKFRLGENFLLQFWYIDYISNWTFNWAVPTYHWLENSWIKRFQWIFDWPNQMAFYLILYTAIFMHFIRKRFQFHIMLLMIFLFGLLVMTYSRSALLWIWAWLGLLFLLNIKWIYKKYKKQLISSLIVFLIIFWSIWFIYKDKIENIFLRTSSTTGHFDRMAIWIDRFIEKPMWSWLAESGPAYRSIYPEKQTKQDEQYYIPESWFIQQLTEWWIVYFLLFILILSLIVINLYKKSKPLFAWLIAIIVMNIFLHIFEATYLSILLFLFIWLIISKQKSLYKY